MADRQQIFESQSKAVVPAIAFDKIIFIRVIAAGALIGKIRIAVGITLCIFKVTDLGDRSKVCLRDPPMPGSCSILFYLSGCDTCLYFISYLIDPSIQLLIQL